MKTITNYREFSDNDSDDSLLDNIGHIIENKEKILKYLTKYDADTVLAHSAYDYVAKRNLHDSLMCYSDGTYLWTNEEVYHFSKYNLKLNDTFIKYVLEIKNKKS